MQITDILSPEKTFNNIISNSKKRALEQSAHLLSLALTYRAQVPESDGANSTETEAFSAVTDNNVGADNLQSQQPVQHVDEFDIFNALFDREQLGSTAIGNGVAIPHCALDNIEQASAVLLRLNEAVDFDSADNEPVDLILALAVPNDQCEHFKSLLSRLATLLMNTANLDMLRRSEDSEALFDALIACESRLLLNPVA